jgi:hypothetical protein
MASVKTVEYWFPELAAVADKTDVDFTQITLYLPENAKSFVSVTLECIIQDAEASSTNVNRFLSILKNPPLYP